MYVRVNSPAVWLHASAGVWCISSVIVPARPREPVSSIIAIVIGTTSTPNQRAYSQYSSSALLLVPQAGRPTRGRPSEAMSRRARAPATMHGAGCATCRCARRMRRVTLPLHRPAPAATCQMLCYCSLAAVGCVGVATTLRIDPSGRALDERAVGLRFRSLRHVSHSRPRAARHMATRASRGGDVCALRMIASYREGGGRRQRWKRRPAALHTRPLHAARRGADAQRATRSMRCAARGNASTLHLRPEAARWNCKQ